MRRHLLPAQAITAVLLAGLACTTQAQATDEDFGPDARFVAELIGQEYCEVIPSDMPAEALDQGLDTFRAEGLPLISVQLRGFMEEVEAGASLFGTRDTGTSFTAVHSLWGTLSDGRMATLCLHALQIGDVPADTGTFAVRGLNALASATPGDVVISGIVAVLEDTGNVNERGQRIMRRSTIGEVSVSDGEFTLTEIDRERYSGSMRLQGHLRMDGSESPVALQIDAELAGIRELKNVPTLTSDGS